MILHQCRPVASASQPTSRRGRSIALRSRDKQETLKTNVAVRSVESETFTNDVVLDQDILCPMSLQDKHKMKPKHSFQIHITLLYLFILATPAVILQLLPQHFQPCPSCEARGLRIGGVMTREKIRTKL